MKALSIRNPWAVLVAAGIKDVENRGYKTRHRGRIFIHATKYDLPWLNSEDMPAGLRSLIKGAVDIPREHLVGPVAAFDSILRTCIAHYMLPENIDDCDNPSRALSDAVKKYGAPYPSGAIIGEADIVDCVYEHSSEWSIPYKWKWVMENAELYPVEKQIRGVKGRLGLWNFDM